MSPPGRTPASRSRLPACARGRARPVATLVACICLLRRRDRFLSISRFRGEWRPNTIARSCCELSSPPARPPAPGPPQALLARACRGSLWWQTNTHTRAATGTGRARERGGGGGRTGSAGRGENERSHRERVQKKNRADRAKEEVPGRAGPPTEEGRREGGGGSCRCRIFSLSSSLSSPAGAPEQLAPPRSLARLGLARPTSPCR